MHHRVKDKGSPYSITGRRVPELIPVLGSQPTSDVSHKSGGRLSLLSARPAEGCYQFRSLVNRGTMGVNSLPKTVARQRHGCDLNPGLTAPARVSPARHATEPPMVKFKKTRLVHVTYIRRVHYCTRVRAKLPK